MSTAANYSTIEQTLIASFGPLRLIAVSYLDAPPAGVERFTGSVPSGCSFWSLALRQGGFYTVPSDHLNCPIGAYTHAIDLPNERASELQERLSLMSSIGYVRLEEVPSIPRLPKPPSVVYYAPLSSALVSPDVVIAAGRPASLMRLQEAVARAGAASQLPLLGRPTCMALPAAMAHGAVMSTGCIGNRVYTGLGDDELYLMIPGQRLADVAAQAGVIASANQTLAEYHQGRRASLTS
jgi:uncharacterized protein (DUF169 family)